MQISQRSKNRQDALHVFHQKIWWPHVSSLLESWPSTPDCHPGAGRTSHTESTHAILDDVPFLESHHRWPSQTSRASSSSSSSSSSFILHSSFITGKPLLVHPNPHIKTTSKTNHENPQAPQPQGSASCSLSRHLFERFVEPKKTAGTRKNCQCNCHQNHQNTKTPAKWFAENASPASNMEIFWGINNHHRDLWKVESCCTLPS